jgi:hypothetical protein
MIQANNWNVFIAVEASGEISPDPGNDVSSAVDQNRYSEAELPHASGEGPNLPLGMFPRVVGARPEALYGAKRDLPMRSFRLLPERFSN